MLYSVLKILKQIGENPYVNIVVGLILLYSGISETVHELENVKDFKVGVHHGVIFFSIMHVLKTVPDLFESLERIEAVEEESR